VERCLNEIIHRHEILRTTFQEVEGQITLTIAPTLKMTLPFIDLTPLSNTEKEMQALQIAHTFFTQSFDLSRGPLLRFSVLRWDAQQQILLLSAHHTVFDASSVAVFAQEMDTLLDAFSSEKPRRGKPNAAVAAGDEGGLVRQSHQVFPCRALT